MHHGHHMVLMWFFLRRWPRLRRTGIMPPHLVHLIWLSGIGHLLSLGRMVREVSPKGDGPPGWTARQIGGGGGKE